MLAGKKTYIVGIVTLLYGIIVHGWQNDDWQAALETILWGLGLLGLRAGVSKVKQ